MTHHAQRDDEPPVTPASVAAAQQAAAVERALVYLQTDGVVWIDEAGTIWIHGRSMLTAASRCRPARPGR